MAGNKPAYLAKVPQKPDDPENKYMTTIGAAFPLRSGADGYVLSLHALPVGNTIILVPPKDE